MIISIITLALTLVGLAHCQEATTQRQLQRVTFVRTTRWQYIPLEPIPGEDLEPNPFRTSSTTTTTTTPRPTGSTHAPGPDVFQTDFDDGLGGMVHDSAASTFNWTRWTMKCPSPFTGPMADHTTGSGFYMLILASDPRRPGDVARLSTPVLSSQTGCANVTFWYHAYGYHLGRFTVKVAETPFAKYKTIFEIKGPDQDQTWRFASVIAPGIDYKIAFEAVVGDGYQGDYAIDDIYIRSAQCPSSTPSPSNTTDPLPMLGLGSTPESSGIQGWAIALIIVSVIAVVAAVLLAVYIVYRQKKLRLQREQEEKEEEERRQREIEEEGVIHTDRAYSSRMRSGMASERPDGRLMASAQRRMAPGYGARPGSRMASNYGRLDIPSSAMSKRGHSPNSNLAVQGSNNDYGYEQEGDVALGQAGDASFRAASARVQSARIRGPSAVPGDREQPPPPARLPSIFGGDSLASAALRPDAAKRGDDDDFIIGDSSPLPNRRGDIGQPATMRPETPKNQASGGKDEKMNWFD